MLIEQRFRRFFKEARMRQLFKMNLTGIRLKVLVPKWGYFSLYHFEDTQTNFFSPGIF